MKLLNAYVEEVFGKEPNLRTFNTKHLLKREGHYQLPVCHTNMPILTPYAESVASFLYPVLLQNIHMSQWDIYPPSMGILLTGYRSYPFLCYCSSQPLSNCHDEDAESSQLLFQGTSQTCQTFKHLRP